MDWKWIGNYLSIHPLSHFFCQKLLCSLYLLFSAFMGNWMALAYQIKKICRIASLLQLLFPFQPLLYFFIYMLEMNSIVVNFTFELLPERFHTNTVWTIFYYFILHLFCFWQTFFFSSKERTMYKTKSLANLAAVLFWSTLRSSGWRCWRTFCLVSKVSLRKFLLSASIRDLDKMALRAALRNKSSLSSMSACVCTLRRGVWLYAWSF